MLHHIEKNYGLICYTGSSERYQISLWTKCPDIRPRFCISISASCKKRTCLKFFWRQRTGDHVQICKYWRLLIGTNSSASFPKFALERAALYNDEKYSVAGKAIQNDFYRDNLIKLVLTLPFTIEILSHLQLFLSQHGYEMKMQISKNFCSF